MDDGRTGATCGRRERRDVVDHRRGGARELGEQRQVADHAALTLVGDDGGAGGIDERGEVERHRHGPAKSRRA